MRTLYVADHAARLRVRKRNLVVERSREATRVPIETLEAVVLLGRADLSNDALGELARRRIRVSALSRSGRLRFTVGGTTGGNVRLRIAQHRACDSSEQSLAIARTIVAGKLQNSRRAMKRWEHDADSSTARRVIRQEVGAIEDRLRTLPFAEDGDTVRGIEGDGSRRYFKAMALHLGSGGGRLDFGRRTRRPPRDPVNALLSFAYGLVLTEVIGALEVVGLDPQVGFLHRPRPGRPSLALDLLEEFRASLADRLVVNTLRRGQLTVGDFEQGPASATYLTEAGRRKVLEFYEQQRQEQWTHSLLDRPVAVALLPSVQATLMARHLRGDVAEYPPFVAIA